MYAPVLLEFSWAFSRFIDIVVEVPQLKMTHASDKLDGWIIAYYCSIGSQVFFSTLNLIERFVENWQFILAVESSFHPPFLGLEPQAPSIPP